MTDYKKIKGYYDEYGSWYDDERIEGYYAFINEIEVDEIRKHSVNKKTLEIGCGTGIILNQVSKFTKESWGIDLSSGMLEAAKKKGLKVKEANATKLPFKDNTFDVTYSFKVLAHIPEIDTVIDEAIRVTKPEGVIIFEYYNPYSLKYVTNLLAGGRKKVFIRYDSLSDIKKLYRDKLTITRLRGARILTPAGFIMRIPFVGNMFEYVEKALSHTLLNRFAGYFIVVAKPISKT